MAKVPLVPVQLYAVVGAEHDLMLPAPELQLLPFRDVAAVVRPLSDGSAFTREALLRPPEVAAHRRVVEALHRQGAVLPVPVGTAARDQGTIVRWLEVHHVTLCEALSFVDGRCGARVHVTRATVAASSSGPLDVPPLDLDGTATELFRLLRRHAAASTSIRQPDTEADRATAAFLVESDRWSQFADAVASEGNRHAGVHVDLSGPWPPYDFVKMQFGG
jgi:hypothetical protein